MKKIIVTGALGHIGSRLVRELPATFPDSTIVMLDDLSTQRYCSLFNLPTTANFRFHEGSVLTADLGALFDGADAVVHLAAMTDAANSFKIRDHVHLVNVDGTQRVADACIATGTPLIFPSTTSVYGTQEEVVDEQCQDLKPQSPYADSKLAGEMMLADLSVKNGLRFVTCRLGTIFGVSEGMRFHTAVNKFCWQAVMEQPITVWRTALCQNRPYLDLADGVRAIAFIIQHELYDGTVYNVVSTNASVGEITDIIGHTIPNVSIEYVDTEIMNQLSYHVTNDKFAAAGFEFRGSLKKGIKQTLDLLRGSQSVLAK